MITLSSNSTVSKIIKLVVFIALIALLFAGLTQCSKDQFNAGVDTGITTTENGTLTENIEDAKKLNRQNTAINAGPSLLDVVLPKQTENSGRESRQNDTAKLNTSNANANSENLRGVEGNYRVGVAGELPISDLLQSAAAELLPVKCRIEKQVDELGFELVDDNDQFIYREVCE